jgi:hypothetical protein
VPAGLAVPCRGEPEHQRACDRMKPEPLGPRWVRDATVEQGQQGSPPVASGSKEPQVAEPQAQAAAMMPTGDSDCGPEGHREARQAFPRPPQPRNVPHRVHQGLGSTSSWTLS